MPALEANGTRIAATAPALSSELAAAFAARQHLPGLAYGVDRRRAARPSAGADRSRRRWQRAAPADAAPPASGLRR
jgi:hypothetical protein